MRLRTVPWPGSVASISAMVLPCIAAPCWMRIWSPTTRKTNSAPPSSTRSSAVFLSRGSIARGVMSAFAGMGRAARAASHTSSALRTSGCSTSPSAIALRERSSEKAKACRAMAVSPRAARHSAPARLTQRKSARLEAHEHHRAVRIGAIGPRREIEIIERAQAEHGLVPHGPVVDGAERELAHAGERRRHELVAVRGLRARERRPGAVRLVLRLEREPVEVLAVAEPLMPPGEHRRERTLAQGREILHAGGEARLVEQRRELFGALQESP